MSDKDFKNMVLLGLSNIQWMLAHMIDVGKEGKLSDSAIYRANNFHDLTRKYVNGKNS